MSMNSDLRADVIECIVNCPVMGGFENYGDKTPNLASRIFANFDIVETGIIQGVDQEKWSDMIKKMVDLRQGGQLIDIWKEIYKSVEIDQKYQYGRLIKDLIIPLSNTSILDVEKLSGKGQVFANFKNVIDGAQHRWEKFKKAVANNEPWKADRAERQFNLILRDYAAQQSDIIKRIWGDEYLETLLADSDLGSRYNTIKLEFSKVRDAKIRSVQGTKKMHENMKDMHSTRQATSSSGTTHTNTFTTFELPPATTLTEALGLIKAVIEYKALNNDQKCQQIWEMIESSPIRLEIMKNLKTNHYDHLKGDVQVPMLHLIEWNLDHTLTANGIKTLRKKVSNWVLERIRKGDVDDRIKEILTHQSVYGHGDRDHVAQPWDKNHAGWYSNAEPEEKENEMTPQEDFMKSIFVDVLKERSPAWFADATMSGEQKEIVDKLVDQLYENFVKPTFAKLDERQLEQEVVHQVPTASGQMVEIKGPKNDPLVSQLVQLFAPKPKIEVSGYRHVSTFTAGDLIHQVVYNEATFDTFIQVSHQLNYSVNIAGFQTVFSQKTCSLEAALRIFDIYKEKLRVTADVNRAAQAAMLAYLTIHPNKQ